MAIQQTGLQFVARDLGSFISGLKSAASAVGSFVSSAQKSAGSINILSGHFKNFGQDLAYVGRHLLLDAFRQIGDAVSGVVSKGLDQVAVYDRMTGSLTALTAKELLAAGSVNTFAEGMSKAAPIVKENIRWIEKLALISTFESDEIASVQQYAQSVGIATNEAKLMTFALTAWGTVTKKQPHELLQVSNALTDMFTKGRVQAEEMRQLTRNNIPAWDYLAKAMGVTTDELREMVSDGLVPASAGIKAIVEGIAKDYGPAMKDFTFSIAGITSSFQDLAKVNLRELFLPMVEAALPTLTRFVSILSQDEFRQKVQMLGFELGTMAQEALNFGEAMFASGDPFEFLALQIDNVLPGFLSFYQQLEKLGSTLGEIASKAFEWGASIGKNLAQGLLSAASQITTVLQGIADAINSFLSGKGLGKGKGGGAGPGDLSEHPPGMFPGGPPGPGEGEGGLLPEGDLGIDDSILAPITEALDQLNASAEEAKGHWANLRAAFEEARAKALEVSAAIGPLNPIVAGLGLAFGSVLATGAASAALNLVKVLSPIGLLTGGMTLLYTAWTENWGGIQEITAEVVPAIGEMIADLPTTLQGLGDSIQTDVMPALEEFANWFTGPGAEGVQNFAKEAGPAFKELASEAGPALQELIDLGSKVVSWFATNWPNIGKLLGQTAAVIKSTNDTVGASFKNVELALQTAGIAFDVFGTVVQTAMQLAAGDVDGAAATVGTAMQNIAQALGLSQQQFQQWQVIATQAGIGLTASLMGVQTAVIGIVADIGAAILDFAMQVVGYFAEMASGVATHVANFGATMNSISGFVDSAIGALKGLVSAAFDAAAALASIVVPAPLLGHSPSPFETSLYGVTEALKALKSAAVLVGPAFGQLLGITEDIQDKLRDLADEAADLIYEMEINLLDARASGFERMGNNASLVTDMYKAQLSAQKDLIDAQNDYNKAVADGDENKAAAASAAIMAASDRELALAMQREKVEAQIEGAREAFQKDMDKDPENALALFNLRSKHIKDLANLDAQIDATKDATLREYLIKERNFMHLQQTAELDLFQKQADRRSQQIKDEVKEIAEAWADAWNDLTLNGDFVGPIAELYDWVVKLSQLTLPEWLTPGSPTPLENALVGIGKAVRKLSGTELPRLQSSLNMNAASPVATPSQIASSVSSSYTYAPQFNLGVQTNNSPAAVFQSYDLVRSVYG